MKVQQFDTLLERLATGEITSDELSLLHTASEENSEWRQSFETVQEMVALLGSQKAGSVTVPDSFNASLSRRLDKAVVPSHRRMSFFAGLTAVAASLIFFLFLYHPSEVINKMPEQRILLSETVTTPGQPVTITIDYEAPKDIENAMVVITLNGDTRFVSSSQVMRDKREIVWRGKLTKGSNPIPFTVQVPQKGCATISTKALYNGIEHPHLILLDSDGTRVTVLQYRLLDRANEDA